MAFNYDDSLDTDRDRVRFRLQDTVENSGPKPSGGNFTDNEIDGLITNEGTWQRAVAAGFEALEAAWSIYADLQVGPRQERYSQIASRYGDQADKWRAKHGYGGARAIAALPLRRDGYSGDTEDVYDGDEFTDGYSEYFD
jgi:hypothetical protein